MNICENILAIDPGNLHPSIASLDRVRHLQFQIQSPAVETILRSYTSKHSSISICVCDMNCDAAEASGLLAKHVIPFMGHTKNVVCENAENINNDSVVERSSLDGYDCFVVLTLKLLKNPKPHHIMHAVEAAKHNFAPFNFVDFKVVHLNANSKNERTLICRIKAN